MKENPSVSSKEDKAPVASSVGDNEAENEPVEESAWRVIRRHPAFLGLVFMGIPYLLHLTARYVALQHPEWVSFAALLRPAVPMDSERQVLVVGSMSSGTSQVAHELNEIFPGLEVGHEESDSLWKFVRDGTVSWFHGVRFFPQDYKNSSVPKLCGVAFSFYTSKSNYGFGPTLFGTPNYNCSHISPKFKRCWWDACVQTLSKEYGCAHTNTCPTPFETTLLQTREPWNIANSLVAKYCWSDDGKISHNPPVSLIRFLKVLFPFSENIFEVNKDDSTILSVCASQMTHYVIFFYTFLLESHEAGLMDGMFAIESSSACAVAQMAGLFDQTSTVYSPNHVIISAICQDQSRRPGLFGKNRNVISRGRMDKLELIEIVDHDLITKMKDLYVRLGYEYPASLHS
jgi:hypothetical protein